jgi:hypothetical protein
MRYLPGMLCFVAPPAMAVQFNITALPIDLEPIFDTWYVIEVMCKHKH